MDNGEMMTGLDMIEKGWVPCSRCGVFHPRGRSRIGVYILSYRGEPMCSFRCIAEKIVDRGTPRDRQIKEMEKRIVEGEKA